MHHLSFLALLATTASALQITAPSTNDKWDLSQTNTIKWSFVSTDESEFSLKLVDKRTSPETLIPIADKVKTSDGKFDLNNFLAAPGSPYTVKAFSLAKTNSGQLAESQVFNVTKSGVATASTSTVAVPSGTETPTGSTVAPKNGAGRLSGTVGLVGSIGVVFAFLF